MESGQEPIRFGLLSRERAALAQAYAGNERLFTPLKAFFFEFVEKVEFARDFSEMMETLAGELLKDRPVAQQHAQGTDLEELMRWTDKDLDDAKFYLLEWVDTDSFYFVPGVKSLYELARAECRKRNDESLVKYWASIPPDHMELVFPWTKGRSSAYLFLSVMLVGQFMRSLMLNFVAKWMDEQELEGDSYEALSDSMMRCVTKTARKRIVEKFKTEADDPASELTPEQRLEQRRIAGVLATDDSINTQDLIAAVQHQQRQRRECLVCRKTEGDGTTLSSCGRCLAAFYCCREHQKADWPNHRSACVPHALKAVIVTPVVRTEDERKAAALIHKKN